MSSCARQLGYTPNSHDDERHLTDVVLGINAFKIFVASSEVKRWAAGAILRDALVPNDASGLDWL
jgi:hypothetical protein